jgi:hypothetical protein
MGVFPVQYEFAFPDIPPQIDEALSYTICTKYFGQKKNV